MFEKIAKESLPEKIANHLLDLIREKRLKPGDKLPPERELAVEMQISRPVLREALRALAHMNVLEIHQGDGIYIASLEPELLVEHLDFVFSLSGAGLLTLFEARRVLETGIIEIATSKITDEQLARIEEIVQQSLLHSDNPEQFSIYDLELHRLITEAASNPIFTQIMEALITLGKESRNHTVRLKGVIKQAVLDHQKIFKALQNRDPVAARLAMLDHLNNVECRLREDLENS
jgi:GntR family transcriptional regulator, transcriptional repressor for pyruvate dehydrogenase complex